MKFLLFFLFILAVLSCKKVDEFSVTNPGFVSVVENAKSQHSLYISSFTGNPFEKGKIYVVEDIEEKLASWESAEPKKLNFDFQWPNGIETAPSQFFGKNGIIINDGFLMPGKDDGKIYFLDTSENGGVDASPVTLSTKKSGWYYHQCKFHDFDNDGIPEIIAASGHKPLFGSGTGELVMLKQSKQGGSFTETVLAKGPDTFVELYEQNGTVVIYAAEYFSKKLTLTYSTSNNWMDTSSIKSLTIDADLGTGFDIKIQQFYGKDHLLVTSQGDSGKNGYVAIYEIPDNLLDTGSYTKHIIAKDFNPKSSTEGSGAPGICTEIGTTGQIFLSDDDGGNLYLLSPSDSNYNFQLSKIEENDKTVGSVTLFVYGHSNYIIVANYSKGKVELWRC
ncbi:hypothetical protein M0813_17223 [Anaeramoeba flamelloides]|uniref:Uncharacterized protein n=1 Tax=Anaeramoeba flamelloides TaxID=1746091 RepID=A0ABQ8YWG0_9EUKA|nr:hypothetical protein M0813_17223 [Anaeramoeba flamelloides]